MRLVPLLLALPLLAGAAEPYAIHEKRFRFELVVGDAQGGTYITAWANGDVIADHDGSDHQTITYRRTFHWYDGCDWESHEMLVPTSADAYTYSYSERVVSCPDGSRPDGTTQRTGTIRVHPAPDTAKLTPLVAKVTLARP